MNASEVYRKHRINLITINKLIRQGHLEKDRDFTMGYSLHKKKWDFKTDRIPHLLDMVDKHTIKYHKGCI